MEDDERTSTSSTSRHLAGSILSTSSWQDFAVCYNKFLGQLSSPKANFLMIYLPLVPMDSELSKTAFNVNSHSRSGTLGQAHVDKCLILLVYQPTFSAILKPEDTIFSTF